MTVPCQNLIDKDIRLLNLLKPPGACDDDGTCVKRADGDLLTLS